MVRDEYSKEQKTKCFEYCLKKGISKQEAQKIADKYEKLGLEFPIELLNSIKTREKN